MTVGSILFGIALLIVVGLFVGRPLLISEAKQTDLQSARLGFLQQKATLLQMIQSLDFDYETGKMPTDLYESQRAQLVKETAGLIERLETAVSQNGSAELDVKIEAAIARVRGQSPTNDLHAFTGVGRFCAQCGSPISSDDIFCSNCGHKLRN